MTEHEEDFPPFPFIYVKRPDLRPNEMQDPASPEELNSWSWWIQDFDLYQNELEGIDPLTRINALDLPCYQQIHGKADPAKILALFCLCHEWRVYPPSWIMNELYSRFDEYLKDNGTGKKKRSLGLYFGENERGARPAFFRQEAVRGVMETALIAVDRLRYQFNLPKDQAIGLAARLFETVENKTVHKFQKGEAALEKAYREWIKGSHYQEWIERFVKNPIAEETKNGFLRSFPPGTFTGYPEIEKLLKD